MTTTAPTAAPQSCIAPVIPAPAGIRPFLAGARAMLPWLAGVVPFGLTIGVTVAESSVDPWAGWATGWLIYAGSAQLLSVELLDQGAAPLVVVATVLAVNARLVVYSGAMAPRWQPTGWRFKATAAYLLIDPSFAVGADGYHRHDGHRGHAHYLGAAITLWVAWQTAIGVGIVAGTAVPDLGLLSLVVPFYLVAELVRVVDGRPAAAGSVVAAVAAILGAPLPFHAGAVVAIAAGVGAAVLLERTRS